MKFRCQTHWQNGARAFHRFSGYHIDGNAVHEDGRRFVVLSDEPLEFGASDAAPAPAEQLLGALAGCIAATTNAFASLEHIRLTQLVVNVEGNLNLQGMFALQDTVPIGFKNIQVKVAISGAASEDALGKLAESGFQYSPVRNTLNHGVEVKLRVKLEATG